MNGFVWKKIVTPGFTFACLALSACSDAQVQGSGDASKGGYASSGGSVTTGGTAVTTATTKPGGSGGASAERSNASGGSNDSSAPTPTGGITGRGGALNTSAGGNTQSTPGSGGTNPGKSSGGSGNSATGGMVGQGGVATTGSGGTVNSGGSATPSAGGKANGGSGGTATASGTGGGGAGSVGGVLSATGGGGTTSPTRSIWFGTLLDAATVTSAAQQLAKTATNTSSAQWRAKGDQHRTYYFADANTNEPYRLYVPTKWDGQASLPLVMFLHGSGSNENTYVDQNDKQLITLAEQHGYLLVSPLGDKGAYGNFLRLTSPFGNEAAGRTLMSEVTTDSERTNELSEKDVINVLELVINEYPVDRSAMFLAGHSMGSGGTWYIGGKYATYWKGLAPLSGPFVQETGYPWESLRNTRLFVTEGTQAPSVDASRLLRDWLSKNGFKSEYKEVNADHGGMIKLVMPDIFDFFDSSH
ncbi:MAG TPA: hypothetical protein VIV60_07445 [Polyangiaceae bacterium]